MCQRRRLIIKQGRSYRTKHSGRHPLPVACTPASNGKLPVIETRVLEIEEPLEILRDFRSAMNGHRIITSAKQGCPAEQEWRRRNLGRRRQETRHSGDRKLSMQ